MSKPNAFRLACLSTVGGIALLFPLVGWAEAPTTPAPQAPAATPAKPAPEDFDARRKADREAFFASRLAALHAGLQLKQDQESLWAPVEDALRDLKKTHGHHHSHHGEGAGSAQDLQKMGDHLVARGQAITKLANATAPLVASLTPEQKDRLPFLLRDMRPGRLLDRAFAVEADRDDDSGNRWEHRHHRSLDRDEDGGRGVEHRGDRDERGEFDDRRGWNNDRAERDGPGDRFDRQDRGGADYDWHPRHHHHDDDDGDRDAT